MSSDASRYRNPAKTRRRARNLLLDPAFQLKLPFHVLLVTLGCALLVVSHGFFAFRRLYAQATLDGPNYLEPMIRAQLGDFLVFTVAVAVAYMIVVLFLSVYHSHHFVGPNVALRRHVEALKNGDYDTRVNLRDGDAFMELARDLDELAELMSREHKPAERDES